MKIVRLLLGYALSRAAVRVVPVGGASAQPGAAGRPRSLWDQILVGLFVLLALTGLVLLALFGTAEATDVEVAALWRAVFAALICACYLILRSGPKAVERAGADQKWTLLALLLPLLASTVVLFGWWPNHQAVLLTVGDGAAAMITVVIIRYSEISSRRIRLQASTR